MVSGLRTLPLVLLLAGCSSSTPEPTTPSSAPPAESAQEAELPLAAEASAQLSVYRDQRVGDRLVHVFSGWGRGEALSFTEEVAVVARDHVVLKQHFEQGLNSADFLVVKGASSDRLVSVRLLVAGEEQEDEGGSYQKWLDKTTFAPDASLGKTDEYAGTCLVGQSERNCHTSFYKVAIGNKDATLQITRSDEDLRDVSGSVTTQDGRVLYRAELVEFVRGSERPGALSATAQLAH